MPKNCYERNGIWWFRATIAGVEHRESLRTRDAKVAERRAEELHDKLTGWSRFGERRVSWMEAVIEWQEHIADQLKPASLKRYGVSLGQCEPVLRRRFMDEIDRECISDLIKYRRTQGATTTTIRRDLTAVSSVLGFCEDQGYRDDNPALTRMKRLKEKRDPIILPSMDSVERVRGVLPDGMRAIMDFARHTGCRQAEAVYLEWRDIDLRAGTCTFRDTKNSRPRVIDLSPEAIRAVTGLVRMVGVRWVFHHSGLPFANVASRFRGYVKSAQKTAQQNRAAFHPFRFHDLRHLYAVNYLKDGGSLYTLSRILGHGSVKTTEIYLAHMTVEEQARAKAGSAQNPAHGAAV